MSVLRLKGVYSAGAVLPCGKELLIQGYAAPGAAVDLSLNGETVSALAQADGTFQALLPAMEAGGPYVLQVQSGSETLDIPDIWIGEVFFCSGQSNMEFTLQSQLPAPKLTEYDNPRLRFFHIDQKTSLDGRDDLSSRWLTPCDKENWPLISAVGFQMALRLASARPGMAVGIIENGVGGSNIAAWIDRDTLAALPVYGERLKRYEAQPDLRRYSGTGNHLERFIADQHLTDRPDPSMEAVDCDDSQWNELSLPDQWVQAGFPEIGICCFRRHVTLPEAWSGRELMLSLGKIDQQDVVFVNGHEVGRTGSGNDVNCWVTPRQYRVPAGIFHAGDNLIVIRVTSKIFMVQSGGFAGPADAMFLAPADAEEKKLSLTGPWKAAMEQRFPGNGWDMQMNGEGWVFSLHILFDNMVRPVVGYPLTGMVWYQGEADSTCPEMAEQYLMMLRALRSSWRRMWKQLTMPFYIVQLPGYLGISDYNKFSPWAVTRDAQLRAALEDGTYPVVLSDVRDPWEIHQPDKRTAGARLAALILNAPDSPRAHGPQLISVAAGDGKIRCRFSHAGSALAFRGGAAHGWAVAGEDRRFVPAEAVITAPDTIEVRSALAADPCFVAYGWSANPMEANLVNSEGLPASPFCTLHGYPGMK